MNLQHLRHFLALAEERHFGRAAKRLNMAQPPLSQSLARLETSLGFRLFDRTRRSVSLTPAGEAFLRDLRPALARLDRAVRMANKAHSGIFGHIKIGFVSSAVNDIVPRVIAELARVSPESEVQLRELGSDEQFTQILDGRIDFGFVYSRVRSEPEVRTRIVARYEQLIAIPENWPLAAKDKVSIADLEGLPFIAPPRDYQSDFQTVLESECRKRGFTLHATQEITRSQTALGLVGAGIGISLTIDAIARQGFPGVRFLQLEGLPNHLANELSMAWLTDSADSHQSRILNAIADALTVN